MNGYLEQLLQGTIVTLQLAGTSLIIGIFLGLLFASVESIPFKFLRLSVSGFIFFIRAIPELIVLFFIYFGLADLLARLFHHFVNISAFNAGVTALSLIFGAYASEVFRGAFLAIDVGQVDAAKALGLNRWQCFYRIELPQAWRHALPGLGNLWLVLLKDTAIVMLIGLADLMNNAKIAASTTREPFTFYLIAACIYLVITSVSQLIIQFLTKRSNRYIQAHDHAHLFA